MESTVTMAREIDFPQERRSYVKSLVRGLDVIRSFSRHNPRMTLSEVAQETSMSRAAARRFLHTLVSAGYAETDGKYFWLRPKVLDLGFSFLSSMGIWDIAQPIMTELVRTTHASCAAAILDGHDIVYVRRMPAEQILTVGIGIGARLPAYATSMGRVLLAGLPLSEFATYLEDVRIEKITPFTVANKVLFREAIDDSRRRGWALVDQEVEIGVRSIAVPIKYRNGTTAAAMNIACHIGQASLDELKENYLPPLVEASHRITLSLPQ